MKIEHKFDFLIVGSGFGGSISAMRLSQKGYRVALLEKGRAYRAHDFPQSNWNLKKYLWAPKLGCFGFQKMTWLKGLMLLHGVGVGGGSLVYANTLMTPKDEVIQDPTWPEDVSHELSSHFGVVKQMLGSTLNPYLEAGEKSLLEVARALGVEASFHPTEVGVYFGTPDKMVSDPYFNGAGPDRAGCNRCGGCLVGCRYLAKNTLDLNYLHFALKWGAQLFPDQEVFRINPSEGGYLVSCTQPSQVWRQGTPSQYWARHLILSAGVLGTVDLLLKNRDEFQTLPKLSQRLGENVRTNGESLVGATSLKNEIDYSVGIAIGASIHPNSNTKIENVRYPSGSGAMRFLAVPLTPFANGFLRPFLFLLTLFIRAFKVIQLLCVRDWAKNTVALLVMQTIDQKISLRRGRSIWSFWRRALQNGGGNIPCYFPIAQESAKILAKKIGGEPVNVIGEVLARTPTTAHILGGCQMGKNTETGVIDSHHEAFGHPRLYVVDGSVIPVNLGVNPSLTISALSERFASKWPVAPQLSKDEYEKRILTFTQTLLDSTKSTFKE